MARTKASVGSKIASGKSSKARCSVAPTSSGGSSGSSDKSSRGSGSGNPVCPRETPKWQKPITNFFINKHNDSREADGNGDAAGSSNPRPRPKRNIIHSDDESSPVKARNNDLDETIELEELNGEDSHKIEEYYPKGSKGKGVGKKTKGTKHADSQSVTETNGLTHDNSEKETENGESESEDEAINSVKDKSDTENSNENIDKENVDSNKEKDSNTSDKDSSNKNRNKREREDKLEEDGNVSKKIKVK